MNLRTLAAILLLTASHTVLAATEVMPLSYRTADDVLPVVQSVLGNEGRASNYGNQLIINAPPAKIQEVRDLLKQLDKQPRRLLISVDTSDSNHMNDQGYSVNGTVSAGNAEVRSGRGEVNGRDQVRIINRSTQSRSGGTQQVQTNEGYPALIQVGQSVPLTNTTVDGYGRTYNNTEYRNVTRGFYVTASLTGDLVHISIANNNDRLSQTQQGAIDIQNTDTKVTGRLGEWITIGGVNENSQSDSSGFVQRRSTQGRDDMTLRVKVDALD